MLPTKWRAFKRTLEFDWPEDFVAEFESLSPRMQFLAHYGAKQSTADSYASAKNASEFEAKLLSRMDKIVAGKMTMKDSVTRTTDPVEKEVKRIVDEALARWHRERKAAGKKKASDELVQMWLDQYISRHGEEIQLQAEEIVDRRNALSDEVDVDFEGLEE